LGEVVVDGEFLQKLQEVVGVHGIKTFTLPSRTAGRLEKKGEGRGLATPPLWAG
jgi:hypothetical protein